MGLVCCAGRVAAEAKAHRLDDLNMLKKARGGHLQSFTYSPDMFATALSLWLRSTKLTETFLVDTPTQ